MTQPQKFTVATPTTEKLNNQYGNTTVNFYSDPWVKAKALFVKFLSVCVAWAAISAGVAWGIAGGWSLFLCMFGILAAMSFYDIMRDDAHQSPEGLERYRNETSYKAYQYGVDSDRKIALVNADVASKALMVRQQAQLVTNAKTFVPSSSIAPSPWPEDFDPGDVLSEVVDEAIAESRPRQAFVILSDFIADLYANQDELIKDGNIINIWKNGTTIPWSRRSSHQAQLKDEMRKIVSAIYPRLFIDESSQRVWRINLDTYPTAKSAIDAVSKIV